MKKLLTGIILALAFLCNASVARGETIQVSTGTELWNAIYNHLEDPNVIIQLTDTIDMTDVHDAEQFNRSYDHPFMGTITGYYTYVDKDTSKVCPHIIMNIDYALVNHMKGAKVKGVKFKDCNTSGCLAYHPAVLACTARDCEFTELIFENCKYDDGFMGSAAAYIKSKYGLMTNELYYCKVKSVIFNGCSITKYGSEVGSLAGYAEETEFTDCVTEHFSHFFAQAGNAYIGGLVGKAYRCTFWDCVNMATVAGSEKADNVGGITGLSTECLFGYCTNGGALLTTSRSAWEGFSEKQRNTVTSLLTKLGQYVLSYQESDFVYRRYQMATEKISKMSIQEASKYFNTWFKTAQDYERFYKTQRGSCIWTLITFLYTLYTEISEANMPDEMGGITAAAYGCTIKNCLNAGVVHCADAYGGGIAGKAYSNGSRGTQIEACINRAYVQAEEQTGGIVGSLDESSTVRYCLNMGTVDVLKKDGGPICGENEDEDKKNMKCNFALAHDANYTPGSDGSQPIYYFSIKDVKSGLVAAELNRMAPLYSFNQRIGEDPCPIFEGQNSVTSSDIRDDVDLHYDVADRGDFIMALSDQYADIRLTEDIDFGNTLIKLYSRFAPFRGSIDGQDHALKNIQGQMSGEVDGYRDHKYDPILGEWQYNAMIGGAENATFKNLRFENMKVKMPGLASGFVGLSRNCTYEGISLEDAEISISSNQVGGLVCDSHNDSFTNCHFSYSSTIKTTEVVPLFYSAYAGGLVSKAMYSTFKDCWNSGTISTRTTYAGGIVAYAEHCKMINCLNEGTVRHSSEFFETDDYLGGIAAEAKYSTFDLCINNGSLLCEDEYGGGIVGYGTQVTLNNCLSASRDLDFPNTSTCGSIIGVAEESTMTNCFANVDRAMIGKTINMKLRTGNNYRLHDKNASNSEFEMGVNQQMMESGIVAYWLNNCPDNQQSKPWRQNTRERNDLGYTVIRNLYPVLNVLYHTSQVVTIDNMRERSFITTADELKAYANKVNQGDLYACAVLADDIDLGGTNWTPIGTNTNRFHGLFDGRGHTIKGLTCSVTGKNEDYKGAGLFGVIDVLAGIENVIIDDGSVISNTTNTGAAGIVGVVKSEDKLWGDVYIRNCGNYASVSAPDQAGGILGRVMNNKSDSQVKVHVENCFNLGTITDTSGDGNSALLCGYIKDRGVVRNCWSGGKLLSSATNGTPFNKDNPSSEPEFFVGYSGSLDIENCGVIEPSKNVQAADSNAKQKGVTNVTKDDVACGKLTLLVNGGTDDANMPNIWQQNLQADAYPVWGDKGVYHFRTLSKNKYGTLCLPYEVKSNEQISYYTFVGDKLVNGTLMLTFKYTDTVPAGTPALFLPLEYLYYYFPYTGNTIEENKTNVSGTPDSSWMFTGTFKEIVIDDATEAQSVYYVSDNTIRNAKKVTIAPYRAYFRGPNIEELKQTLGSQNLARVCIAIDGIEDETTALELIYDDEGSRHNAQGKTYNLLGTEVGEGYHGVVIRNGKKILK